MELNDLKEFLKLQEINYREEMNSIRFSYLNENNEISIEMKEDCVKIKIFDKMVQYSRYPKLLIYEVFYKEEFKYRRPNEFSKRIQFPLLSIYDLFVNISKQMQNFAKLRMIAFRVIEEFEQNPSEFFRQRNLDPPPSESWHLNKQDVFIEMNEETYRKIYNKEPSFKFREFFVFLKDLKVGIVRADIYKRNPVQNDYEIMEIREFDLRIKDIYKYLEEISDEINGTIKLAE